MRILKAKTPLPIQNFDYYTNEINTKKKRHGELFPDSLRCLVVGPSNCGKTTVLFSLIFDPYSLHFENIYIFSKTLYQPKYQFLSKALPKEIGYFAYSDNTEIVHPSEARPYSLMVFDDIATEKHRKISDYFTLARHNKIDTFYLCQSYSKCPKVLIRDNVNFLIVFKQDDLNLKHIYSDHVNTDFSFDKFKHICSEAWKQKNGFLVLDKDSDPDRGRYRIGFDKFIQDL